MSSEIFSEKYIISIVALFTKQIIIVIRIFINFKQFIYGTFCVTPDYSDYAYGSLISERRVKFKLGDTVSNETKNLMESNCLFIT